MIHGRMPPVNVAGHGIQGVKQEMKIVKVMKKTIITNLDQFIRWWNEDVNRKFVALDCETTSLDYLDLQLIGISFCYNNRVCYVNFSVMDANEQAIIIDDLDAWLSFSTVIMHNAVFDLKVLYKYGVHIDKIFCTLAGAQLINENLPFHNLKYLAEYWLKVPADQIKKWDEVSADVNSPEFANYGMNDAIWAYRLYEIESKELRRQNLEHLFYEVEMPFCFVLRDLEINGIAVDRKEYESAREELPKLLEESLIEMCKATDVEYWYDTDLFGNKILNTNVNFNSSPQIINLIENKLGFEITERTKPSERFPEGQKSFNKKIKTSFKGKHPFFEHLAKYDELESLLSSFILPLEEYIDSDGRVRTSYGMLVTGRLSSSKPNLQNQPNPKKKKLIYNYRKVFVPGE
jgi:DNA polymerase-1